MIVKAVRECFRSNNNNNMGNVSNNMQISVDE